MYVLHHADKPQLYHGLPENPTISPTVTFWKGIWKPLAAVGFAVTFAASIFHYVGVGPNRVEEDEGEDDKPDSTPADTSLPPPEQTTAEHSDDGEMPK